MRVCSDPGLLFADDTSLFGENVEGLEQSLMVLEERCSRWGMKVNAEKRAPQRECVGNVGQMRK